MNPQQPTVPARDGIPFDALVEQSLVGIYVIQDEVVQYANAVFAGLTGHTPAEIVGMHIRDLTPPWRSEENLQRIRQRVSGEIPSMRFRTQGWHKEGYPVNVVVQGTNLWTAIFGGHSFQAHLNDVLRQRFEDILAFRNPT